MNDSASRMSQKAVYDLLKELDGTATTKQIRELAKKRYHAHTLYLYVTNRLKKLERNGYIIHEEGAGGPLWKIIKGHP